MEKIFIKSMRVFYISMIIVLLLEIVNTFIVQHPSILLSFCLGIIASFNIILFLFCVINSYKFKYYENKRLLFILIITMFILLSLMAYHNMIAYPHDYDWTFTYIDLTLLFTIEFTLIVRYLIIKDLEKIVKMSGEKCDQ